MQQQFLRNKSDFYGSRPARVYRIKYEKTGVETVLVMYVGPKLQNSLFKYLHHITASHSCGFVSDFKGSLENAPLSSFVPLCNRLGRCKPVQPRGYLI